MSTIDLRLGRWQDALADVDMVDAVITDPPYGERTHTGHDGTRRFDKVAGRQLHYSQWTPEDVETFVDAWAPRCRGWFVALTSHDLVYSYTEILRQHNRYVFAPLPFVSPGSRVRLAGDGPSSWTCWIVVSRPKTKDMAKWGTLPGAYVYPPESMIVVGGKPMAFMRALVCDYTRPGDLVCDPCAGGATTLIAAAIEGRRAVGAEMDPQTYAKAQARIAKGFTPSFAFAQTSIPKQGSML